MAGAKGEKEDVLKAFEEDSDAFFDSLLNDAGLDSKPSPKASPSSAVTAKPVSPSTASSKAAAATPPASAPKVPQAGASAVSESGSVEAQSTVATNASSSASLNLEEPLPSEGAAMFRMDSDGDDDDNVVESDTQDATQDIKPPEAPPAPADFTQEDLALREVLSKFYVQHAPEKLSNVNSIVVKYRGINVRTLWVQLCLKYNVPVVEGVDLLGQTLYRRSAFEFNDMERAKELDKRMADTQSSQGSGVLDCAGLFQRAVDQGAKDGDDGLLRLLTFRGAPDALPLRAQVWKVLLGYLPMKRHDEWNAIQAEKRALYAGYRSDLLSINEAHEVQINKVGASTSAVLEAEDLLQEVKNDVDRTRRDFEYFRRPPTQAALLALLFVYARLNPGVRYVQGMNEVAAVILYVMSSDPECAEADAFWCFSELMAEIKDGFMQALDNSGEGVYGMVESVTALLNSYDPELARHLQKTELSLFVFILRWCTLLFAQDVTLPDALRLWDSFIADPSRFQFTVHVCVAVLLLKREDLLQSEKSFVLAEVVQSAPRSTDLDELLTKAFAICAFERRGGALPTFPPRRSQVVDDLSEWVEGAAQTAAAAASEAAAVASEVGAEVTKNFQEKIAPVVLERAGQASAVAAEKAQEVQAWLQETAPARQEAYEQAQNHLSSLWASVRSTSQQVASEVSSSEAVGSAAARLSSAAESASGLFARASLVFAGNETAAQPTPPVHGQS
eukprot:TRINITY_DN5246_c0_g1_i1.p1 TRINITY_DN5246_c0_g1~~TRINITY_DN5246_c0_g1_i1.p1  ORF type:complete len:731 (+),score=159.26 TRINITY_DN5246_c0_g1_i1:50-2242(+)